MRHVAALVALLLLACPALTLAQASKPGRSVAPKASPKDQALADQLCKLYDDQWFLYAMSEFNSSGKDHGLCARESHDNVQDVQVSISALTKLSFTDLTREAARKAALHDANLLVKDWSDMAEALDTVVKDGGWTKGSIDLASNAVDDSQKITTEGAIDKLLKDPTFQKSVPRFYLEQKAVLPDPTGFKLSIVDLVNQPLYLIYVAPGGNAERLKLQSLDIVQSINGYEPKDIDDFKMHLKALVGQSAHISVIGNQGPRDFDVLVPSDLLTYKLPADGSSTTSDAQSPTADQEPTDDQSLADVIVTRYDAILAFDMLIQQLSDPKTVGQPIDKHVMAMVPELKSTEMLLNFLHIDDKSKDAACQELSKQVPILADAIDNVVDASDKARASGKWSDEGKAAISKAMKDVNGLPQMPNVIALCKDPKFQPNLPPIYLELQGFTKDPAGFSLSAFPLMSDTLYIAYVGNGGLAEKLGIKAPAEIEAVNGQAPQDYDDLKAMIKKAAGQTVRIKVQPAFGPETELQAEVPANLGP